MNAVDPVVRAVVMDVVQRVVARTSAAAPPSTDVPTSGLARGQLNTPETTAGREMISARPDTRDMLHLVLLRARLWSATGPCPTLRARLHPAHAHSPRPTRPGSSACRSSCSWPSASWPRPLPLLPLPTPTNL